MVGRYQKIYVPLLLFLGLLIRLPEVYRPLWSDELISVNTLEENFFKNPLYNGLTTNLPLYFWILSIINYISIPENKELLRLGGIVLNILNAWILYKWVHKKYGSKTSIVFLTIFLFAPLQVYYSAELRPYVLSQLLTTISFILLSDFTEASKYKRDTLKNVLLINIVLILGLLSHYSVYIFTTALFLYFLVKTRNTKSVLKTFLIPFFVSVFIMSLYLTNPLFKESLKGLGLERNAKVSLTKFISIKSLTRTKEVMSDYYYYGLYYYRLDYWAQFVLKKLLVGFFLLGTWISIKKKSVAVFILGICLLTSLIGEAFGYYPFGGRHIMPFSFLLYIIVSVGISRLFMLSKLISVMSFIVFATIILSFILFQSCSQTFRSRYTGTGDPQGDIYRYCLIN